MNYLQFFFIYNICGFIFERSLNSYFVHNNNYYYYLPATSLQNFIYLHQSAAEILLFVQKSKMATAAILNFFVQHFGICVCRTCNIIHMPNFVQICAIVNELWATDKIKNGSRRHLIFIIFVHFGQMVYFWWQPATLLQNFIYLRQSAAEYVQKSKMAAAAILNLWFLSILIKRSVSGGSRLHYCKILFIYINRRLSYWYLCKKSKMAAAAS